MEKRFLVRTGVAEAVVIITVAVTLGVVLSEPASERDSIGIRFERSPCEQQVPGQSGVKLMNGVKKVENGGSVLITAQAQMPALTAHFCGDLGGEDISWKLEIQAEVYGKTSCSRLDFTGRGTIWDITSSIRNNLQGGTAALSWTANGISGSTKFEILGTNPSQSDVTAEIKKVTKLWYAEYVAHHESSFRQFVKTGKPLISPDNGVGLFQLTNPTPTCAEVWNWRANVAKGTQILATKRAEATTWMQRQRSQALQETGSAVPVPETVEANCVFKENSTRVIEDGVAMKMFNGASQGNYCAWNNSKKEWKINRLNNLGFNYVNRVCALVPKL